jgi:hypothetical protein
MYNTLKLYFTIVVVSFPFWSLKTVICNCMKSLAFPLEVRCPFLLLFSKLPFGCELDPVRLLLRPPHFDRLLFQLESHSICFLICSQSILTLFIPLCFGRRIIIGNVSQGGL